MGFDILLGLSRAHSNCLAETSAGESFAFIIDCRGMGKSFYLMQKSRTVAFFSDEAPSSLVRPSPERLEFDYCDESEVSMTRVPVIPQDR